MLGQEEQGTIELYQYGIDWSATLDGDTITSSTWTIPSDLTSSGAASSTTTTQIKISGGEHGRTYRVKNKIVTTTRGETFEESFDLRIFDH